MLYLSIAIVIVAAMFVWRQPSINIRYHKTFEYIQPPAPPPPTPMTDEELKELREHAPPTLDDITRALNQTIHELGGE